MHYKGENTLSRARGAKAQKRITSVPLENTIDFRTNTRHKNIDIIPKSLNQEKLVIKLLDPTTEIVVAAGPAGTGKTYLAMTAAVQALKQGRCDRIILTRPAVAVENEKHGFLPGDLISKMEPWTRPLLDVVREFYHPRDIIEMLQDQVIEISPLAFMRGRTFKNAWIVADEMQNATPNQIKMLMTRIGINCKIVLTGDVEQADRANNDNGLLDLVTKLKKQMSEV